MATLVVSNIEVPKCDGETGEHFGKGESLCYQQRAKTFLGAWRPWSFRRTATVCKQGMECEPPKKRNGRPPILSARDKSRFIRKFKSMSEQNPNIK